MVGIGRGWGNDGKRDGHSSPAPSETERARAGVILIIAAGSNKLYLMHESDNILMLVMMYVLMFVLEGFILPM